MARRLAAVIQGAEAIAPTRQRIEAHDTPKPAFGEMERMMGEEVLERSVNR